MTGNCSTCKHGNLEWQDDVKEIRCCLTKRLIASPVISTCEKWESAKPPLGVKPSCLTAESRISDLAEVILRYTEGGCTKHGYEQIKTFAKEIYLQSDLALQMEGENE